MEDVLDVYKRPVDATRPLVCMDEAARQLIGETRIPLAAKPGEVLREDYGSRLSAPRSRLKQAGISMSRAARAWCSDLSRCAAACAAGLGGAVVAAGVILA